jgi:hypothetical protein
MSERLSRGEQLAGIAGLILILVMFLFAWYGIPEFAGAPSFPGADAFDALDDWVNIILVFTAFSAMALALFGSDVSRAPIPLSTITTVLGGISSIVLLIYLISPPDELDRKIGIWLGLVSAVAIALGGYLAMQEEGTSFQGAADRLGGSHGTEPGTPPPPPPPGTGL